MRYPALGFTEQLVLPASNNDHRNHSTGEIILINLETAVSDRLRLKFDVRASNALGNN